MKFKFYTLLAMLICPLALFATEYQIQTSGFSFSPDMINAKVGDVLVFNVSESHTATQVSEATWNANQSTPLPGGFNFLPGTHSYTLTSADAGVIYYVCMPHASMGMKGMIHVELGGTAVEKIGISQPDVKVYPNPLERGQFVTVELPDAKTAGIELYSVEGRLLFQSKTTGKSTPVLLNYGSGIYFLRITGTDKQSTHKIVLR